MSVSRYTCEECEAQVGYQHYPFCSLSGGVVLASQCKDAKAAEPMPVQPAPLCKCNHRFDAHGHNAKGPTACHQENCPCMEYRPMNHDDEVNARTRDDTLHVRAATIARELAAVPVAVDEELKKRQAIHNQVIGYLKGRATAWEEEAVNVEDDDARLKLTAKAGRLRVVADDLEQEES
jgi:hypothetical protein